MKKTPVAVGLLVAASVLLSGCAGAAPTEVDNTLTVGLPSAPLSLDPSKAATGMFTNFVVPAYASLLNRAPDGSIVEGLADEWGYVGDDNTAFEVSLRDGVQFADGTPITAADVVASMQYFAAGSGPNASQIAPLEITAVDDDTVSIKSPTPNPVLADLLLPETLAGAIVSPAGLEDPAKLSEASFGAGPYVYDPEQSVSGDTYVYTPNENYYAPDEIHFESITIRVFPNMNSSIEALRSGQVDFIQGNADAAAAFEGDDSIKREAGSGYWAGLFLLDRDGTVVPALADERVRQAINFAVDRAAITTAVYGESAVPIGQPIAAGFDGYSEGLDQTYSYDPDRAKELLAEAGYADGFTLPVQYGSFDPDNTKLVQAVQAQLAEVGITVELKAAANFGDWVGDLLSKQYAASVLSPGWGGSEWFIAQGGFMPGGIMNPFGAEDAEVSAAFGEFALASDDDRAELAQALNTITVEKALSLPISAPETIVLFTEQLQGVEFTVGNGLPTYVTAWSFN
jgi:peptide/nickel transport system substrate-binding protein